MGKEKSKKQQQDAQPQPIGAFVHQCSRCKEYKGNHICSRCLNCFYCSRECQAADWKQHKLICRPAADHDEESSSIDQRFYRVDQSANEDMSFGLFFFKRIYTRHALKKGQILTVTENERDILILASPPPIKPDWNRLLPRECNPEEQESYWRFYVMNEASNSANICFTDKQHVEVLRDIDAKGELFLNVPQRWLTIQFQQILFSLTWFKMNLIPLEILKSSDCTGKDRVWQAIIRPSVQFKIDPRDYAIMASIFDEGTITRKRHKPKEDCFVVTADDLEIWRRFLLVLIEKEYIALLEARTPAAAEALHIWSCNKSEDRNFFEEMMNIYHFDITGSI